MTKNRIFIFEWVSGGGFNSITIPSSLFCEGFGMLRSLILDFKELGFEIVTQIDIRIKNLIPFIRADEVHIIDSKDNVYRGFKKMIKSSKYCFIIAPESSYILYNLTKVAKKYCQEILSIDLKGISLASSKLKTYTYFMSYELKTPKTWLIPEKNNALDKEFIEEKFRALHSPFVIKPLEGVGAESIFYLQTRKDILDFFQGSINEIDTNRKYILQNFIPGEDLSVSLIGQSQDKDILASDFSIMSINSQKIILKDSEKGSEYFGGETPIKNYNDMFSSLEKLISQPDLSDFVGYYGIDFIRTRKNEIYFLEINPRLTTSYIGIRNILSINPAQLIMNAKMKLNQNLHVHPVKHSIFSRYELLYQGEKSYKYIINELIPEMIQKIPEIVTPPISFANEDTVMKNRNFSVFLATNEVNADESYQRIKEVFNTFKAYDFQILK
jgi:predicted ATP-grasp superfamily ATP-dependent carboligase